MTQLLYLIAKQILIQDDQIYKRIKKGWLFGIDDLWDKYGQEVPSWLYLLYLIQIFIQMAQNRIEQLTLENSSIRDRITQFRNHQSQGNLKVQINRFVEQSKKNLNEMNRKIVDENGKNNELLHALTTKYQHVLKKQIELLTENKNLSEEKQAQDATFNDNIEKLTQEYEGQIKGFETKVKANVKKIQDLSGQNIINRLLKNKRFRAAMNQRGCSLDSLEKQSQLEEISQEVQEKQKEIVEAQQKSARLDEQLSKMHELIDTMKSLLENMMKEKQNIQKQNAVLKQKLKQSEQLIGRLLGGGVAQEQEQKLDEQQGEDQDDS